MHQDLLIFYSVDQELWQPTCINFSAFFFHRYAIRLLTVHHHFLVCVSHVFWGKGGMRKMGKGGGRNLVLDLTL